MKRKLLSTLFITGLLATSSVYAQNDFKLEKTTLSAGYAQVKMAGQNPMHGGIFSIRQEINSQFGVLATATYAQNEYDLNKPINTFFKDVNARYYSVMAGPTIRLNDFISVYGTAGMSQIQFKSQSSELKKLKKNAFSWGAGLIINPAEMVSISLGYENSRFKFKDADSKIILDGFVANIGYRF
ncbi:Ail/Lom family outer membrane beta-barrel protein [Proteus terrae]|uniref:Ail/Lom family outer membrane beta-barrel protein n=1 Tax=Proteus terrae TaxID=1574161 RepID=UPI00233080C2|nr:Ail/Lom family outer membrane beta-barrel protein [Proteus terrae]WCG90325.1 Ail/Lom family outer membrane beta-barrel protein [Proteus terrae]